MAHSRRYEGRNDAYTQSISATLALAPPQRRSLRPDPRRAAHDVMAPARAICLALALAALAAPAARALQAPAAPRAMRAGGAARRYTLAAEADRVEGLPGAPGPQDFGMFAGCARHGRARMRAGRFKRAACAAARARTWHAGGCTRMHAGRAAPACAQNTQPHALTRAATSPSPRRRGARCSTFSWSAPTTRKMCPSSFG